MRILVKTYQSLYMDFVKFCLLMVPYTFGLELFNVSRKEQAVFLIENMFLGFLIGARFDIKVLALSFFMQFMGCLKALQG